MCARAHYTSVHPATRATSGLPSSSGGLFRVPPEERLARDIYSEHMEGKQQRGGPRRAQPKAQSSPLCRRATTKASITPEPGDGTATTYRKGRASGPKRGPCFSV